MFVAKFPGSMYATQAMNAGPRNGSARKRVPVEGLVDGAEPRGELRAAKGSHPNVSHA